MCVCVCLCVREREREDRRRTNLAKSRSTRDTSTRGSQIGISWWLSGRAEDVLPRTDLCIGNYFTYYELEVNKQSRRLEVKSKVWEWGSLIFRNFFPTWSNCRSERNQQACNQSLWQQGPPVARCLFACWVIKRAIIMATINRPRYLAAPLRRSIADGFRPRDTAEIITRPTISLIADIPCNDDYTNVFKRD